MNVSKKGLSFLLAVAGCALFSGRATPAAAGSVWDAVFSNDMAAVQMLVAQGQDVNARGNYGMNTPLGDAANQGNVQMVQFLLDHGAKVDATALGATPLLSAIFGSRDVKQKKDCAGVVRVLIKHGANVNFVGTGAVKGLTPIIACGAYGNAEIAKILIDAGADVNAKDGKGKTAADYAIKNKKLEIIAVLKKAGAVVSYTGSKANDIVIAMVSADREKVRSLLEEGADPNAKDKAGKTLLMYSITEKWPEVIELLLKKGVDVNAKDSDGWTAMMHLALANQTELLKVFEQAGVKMFYSGNKKDDLLVAVLAGDREKTGALLAQGADVNAKYRFNSPLLSYAVNKKDPAMTTLLLDNKANPNVSNDYGFSPFLVALANNTPELARTMLERGADVNARRSDGWTALMYAILHGDISMVKELLAKGVQVDANAVILSQGGNPYEKQVNYPEITTLIKPEMLRRQMLRAEAALESAQSTQDYQKAITEYEVARQIAPESPEIYYNLGMIQDKAGAYGEAIKNLRKYLELAPASSDAQSVKDMIYKLEYKRDSANKSASANNTAPVSTVSPPVSSGSDPVGPLAAGISAFLVWWKRRKQRQECV